MNEIVTREMTCSWQCIKKKKSIWVKGGKIRRLEQSLGQNADQYQLTRALSCICGI